MTIPVLSVLNLARRFERSFVVPGAVTVATWPGLFLPIAADETVKLLAVRYKILSGTSASFRLQRNAADITGFGTSGSPLSATTTATTTDPSDVTLSADDYLNFIVSAISATPADLSISMYFESVV